jgi:anti-sigma B factor antagonist
MSTPSERSLALGPEMTIPFAAAVREQLAEALRSPGSLTLDLSGVSDFDSSGVQLVLATRRTLAERGDALHLHAPNACVREAAAVFGLQPDLSPAAVPAQP